ncbi:AraC family transcriptional regulator [Marinomonas agarivorans]|nr:AraC family transcriptional regulator [Marinomonas agarivorans]
MSQLSLEQTTELTLENELWVGSSPMIELTKYRLQSMANSNLPVLIYGKSGTGKLIAARTLHNHAKGEQSPFVDICCKKRKTGNLLTRIKEGLNNAEGGSLFVRHIESLSDSEASLLQAFLLKSKAIEAQKTRLILSSAIKLIESEFVKNEHHFLDWLHHRCLTIELPTLANRVEDIENLVSTYQKHDLITANLHFQSSAWEVFRNYSWPGNTKELTQCLDILTMQTQSSMISKETLFKCFPHMAYKTKEKEQKRIIKTTVGNNIHQYARRGGIDTVPNIIKLPDDEQYRTSPTAVRHPALDRAVVYLYNNFREPICMDELASQACVSSSHLSYLFKHYLGSSFKQTLLQLRIMEAMKLLVENPTRQVTQVCDDVGFSDLSFFVRKFKAIVGMSPGVYRDHYGKVKVSPELLAVEEVLATSLQQLPVRH